MTRAKSWSSTWSTTCLKDCLKKWAGSLKTLRATACTQVTSTVLRLRSVPITRLLTKPKATFHNSSTPSMLIKPKLSSSHQQGWSASCKTTLNSYPTVTKSALLTFPKVFASVPSKTTWKLLSIKSTKDSQEKVLLPARLNLTFSTEFCWECAGLKSKSASQSKQAKSNYLCSPWFTSVLTLPHATQ